MTKDEALKLALKTLEQIQEGCNNVIADKLHSDAVDLAKLVRKDCNKPIDAIRKALAQPEFVLNGIVDAIRKALAQPEFVLNGIDCSCGRKWRVVNNTLTAFEHPEQEPVAWRSWNDKDGYGFWDTKAEANSYCDLDFRRSNG